MKPDRATRKNPSGVDAEVGPHLRDSDAIWLQRGQRLGETLLTSRTYAGYGGAAALMLAGAFLVALALLGPHERDMRATVSPEVLSGP